VCVVECVCRGSGSSSSAVWRWQPAGTVCTCMCCCCCTVGERAVHAQLVGCACTLRKPFCTCLCGIDQVGQVLLRASQQGSLRMVTRLVIWCSTTNGQQVVVEALCNHKCDTNMCVLLCKPPCCKCQTRSTSRCLRCQRILIA
jgi:hypothetical protein